MSHDALTELAVGFGLVFMRIGAFVAACPPFAPDILRGTLRAALTICISFALYLSAPKIVAPEHLMVPFLLELICGASMGLVVRLAAVTIHYAGELLDMVVGFGFNHVINPLTSENSAPIQMMSQLVGGLIFFVCGGQEQCILALAKSLRTVPPGEVRWNPQVSLSLTSLVSEVAANALRIAAPLLGTVLATLLVLAFITRVAPQLNVWGIGFLITTGMCLVGLMWFAPSWIEQVAYLWQYQTASMMRTWVS